MVLHHKKTNKVMLLLMMICLVYSSFGAAIVPVSFAEGEMPENSAKRVFPDVQNHWAKETILDWIESGFIEGYSDGTFQPDRSVSRGEVFALINRSFGFSERSDVTFADLTVSDWEYDETAKAIHAGYVEGYPDGTIGVKREISRQEAAIVISRLLGLEPDTEGGAADGFTDVQRIPNWSKGAIAAAASVKIMDGYEDGSFRPEVSITRAELVVMLERALKSMGAIAFDQAGTYGPAEGVRNVSGDVVVNAAGVTLQNMKIAGNLVLAKGIEEGDVYLHQVTVAGTTVLNGGGKNSVHFQNSVLSTVIVDRASGTVRIVVEGRSTIAEIVVKTPATIERTNLVDLGGISSIKISEELAEGSTVTLIGMFDRVDVAPGSFTLAILQGVIKQLSVAETASGVTIHIGKEARIASLILNAVIKVLGEGVVEKAALSDKARGTTFEKQPLLKEGAGAAQPESANSSESGAGGGGENGGNEPAAPAKMISVAAVNGSISVVFDKEPASIPAIGDFTVQRIVNEGAPEFVAPITVSWDAAARKATLKVPVLQTSVSEQSFVYRVSYNGSSALESDAVFVPGGIPIVENGQAKAVVVAPSDMELADERIPGWWPPYTSTIGKVRVVDTKSFSGSYSVQISDENDAENFGAASELIEITPGETYAASSKVYLESGSAPSMLIYFYNSGKELIGYPFTAGGTLGEWTTISVTAAAPAQAAFASVVLFSDTSGVRNVFFDDVALSKEGDNLPLNNPGFERISNKDIDTLIEYVQKSTGAVLPVKTEHMLQNEAESFQGFSRIYIGGDTPSGDEELDEALQGLAVGGYVIKADNDRVSIVSPTALGTEYGVYGFLERNVGVRWLMPGPDGEHVPQQSSIVIPRELVRDEPAAISRHFFGMDSPPASVAWARRNRMHDNIQFHHNLEYLFDPTVFADHPEYYPGGVVPQPGSYNWNPCLNNETAAAAISRIKQYFQQNPGATSYSLGVTDGRSHCESDPNHPNYPGADHLNSIGLLNISDLYYPWVNQIVEGVLEEYPDKYFGLLAYSEVYDPPANADGTPYKLHPHVIPYITDDRLTWLDPDIGPDAKAHIERWLESADNIGFYEYLFGSPYQIPRTYVHKMAENYKYARDHGVVAHTAELFPNFGEGPKPWISAKLQWNPNLDVDALLDEWYTAAAGEAAAPKVKAYFDHWEQFWTSRMFESEWYLTWKNSVPRKEYLNLYKHDYLKLITKEELRNSRELLQEALELTETDEQRARVEALLKSFDYYEASAISYPRTEEAAVPATEAEARDMIAEVRLSIEMARKRLQLYQSY